MTTHTSNPTPMPNDGSALIQVKKRIVLCCDGTWQDGISATHDNYTNVLRLARLVTPQDTRVNPPIPQIVYYQTGIGSEHNFFAYLDGALGASLGAKVQEAYGFIAHNYCPGDEIFLFGFSRGAYTARMVAMFIGAIGLLDRHEMDNFASIFMAYQKRGSSDDPAEIAACEETLAPWVSDGAPGKLRVSSNGNPFSVKCIGVFDTVGSLGLPEQLRTSKAVKTIFGFPDNWLGEHVERAYHALALNETRADFNVCKFRQTAGGKAKQQILEQCWFSGEHSDVGGGWPDHDLADLTLAWMASKINDTLSIDPAYVKAQPKPVAQWGQQMPHDPIQGIFVLEHTIHRDVPLAWNPETQEKFHPSVFQQSALPEQLKDLSKTTPALIAQLHPLETDLRSIWPQPKGPSSNQTAATGKSLKTQTKSQLGHAGNDPGLLSFWKLLIG